MSLNDMLNMQHVPVFLIHNVYLCYLSVLIPEGQVEPNHSCQTKSSGAKQLFDSGGGLHGFYRHGIGDVGGAVLLAPSLPP